MQKENVLKLKAEIERLTNNTSKYKQQIAEYKAECDNKIVECEYLRIQFEELQMNNNRLELSYKEDIQVRISYMILKKSVIKTFIPFL